MKTTFTILGIALLGVLSCSKPEVASDAALRTTDQSGIIPIGGHAHQFPVNSSVKLMFSMVSAAQTGQLSADFGWGGSFPASAFKVAAANQGVLLWYCFKPGADPKLFLALEQLREYDPYNLPTHPISSELTVPTAIFQANPTTLSSENDVRDYLRQESGDRAGWETMPAEQVSRYVASADSLFGRHPDHNGEKYNNYMFGFFSARHEAAFNAFVESAGENGYIRYYFGYDERDRPNRVRIILMAVNARGTNLTMARVSNDSSSMQRSWPPPPEN